MRRRLATAAIVLGALLGSAVAFGDFAFRPIQRFFADDVAIKFGNTEASPDWEVLHETADGDEHNLTILNTDSDEDVVIAWDDGVDWGVANSASLRIHSVDEGAPTEYIAMNHDSTDARITVGSGHLHILPASGKDLWVGNNATGGHDININVAANNTARIIFLNASTQRTIYASNFSTDQTMITAQADGGRQLIVSAGANEAVDHDHDAETNPVLYVQSATDPDPDNTEFISFKHNQTDAVITAGKGDVQIVPASGSLVRQMSYWVKTTITFETGTGTLFTLLDGDMIIAAAVDVNTTFDGSSMDIDIGPASDTDGILDGLDEASKNLGSTGWKCYDWDPNMGGTAECAFKSGGVLKSSGGSVRRYVSSGEVLAVTVNAMGSATQGSADIYFQLVRLQ